MKQTPPQNAHSLLTYDGETWAYYAGESQAMTLRQVVAGTAQVIPTVLLETLQADHTQHLRLLLSAEIHRFEIVLPTKLRFKEIQAILTAELADVTNIAVDELLTVGGCVKYQGMAEPIVLAVAFVKDRIASLYQQLQSIGVLLTGVSALEFACMAAWTQSPSHNDTLLIMGHTNDVLLPGKRRGENPGPTSLSGGIRYLEMDAQDWISRFQRSVRFLEKQHPCHVLTLMERQGPIEVMQRSGFSAAVAINRKDFLAQAVNVAALAVANRNGTLLPLLNPYVPCKRFSHAWIIIPTLVLLLMPLVYWGWKTVYLSIHTRNYEKIAAPYLPLEREIKTARAAKQTATWQLQQEEANFEALVDRRKPLAAFIHVAYFFCKFVGHSIALEKIVEQDRKIVISGTMGDPEDGLQMNLRLKTFVEKYGLVILENKLSDSIDDEGNAISHFDLTIGYDDLKDAVK